MSKGIQHFGFSFLCFLFLNNFLYVTKVLVLKKKRLTVLLSCFIRAVEVRFSLRRFTVLQVIEFNQFPCISFLLQMLTALNKDYLCLWLHLHLYMFVSICVTRGRYHVGEFSRLSTRCNNGSWNPTVVLFPIWTPMIQHPSGSS